MSRSPAGEPTQIDTDAEPMPANLTPQYHKAEDAYKAATSLEEKVSCLEEMIRVIPKHKGTDHLQADLKKRLSKLKKSAETDAKKKGATFNPFNIERGGAGQVPLVGPPNTGKSRLLCTMTRAKADVADYPFTTQRPTPGMMSWEDVPIQLVDLPPIAEGVMPPGMLGLLKSADLLVCVIDLAADDALEQTEGLIEGLEAVKLRLHRKGDDPKLPDGPGWVAVPAIVVGNKVDLDGATDTAEVLDELYGERLTLLRVSLETGAGTDELRDAVYRALERIRVYGKQPGRPQDDGPPFVLPRGATIEDLARHIHRDFPDKLEKARLWGSSAKFDGQVVPRDHILADRDLVELHIAG